tara:strand:- start:1677 stop:2042 length:366 start_codon:yes stop_codon:yes gene_type:complete
MSKPENLTLYTGVSRQAWNNIWSTANLSQKLTNMTTDIDFAFDYSYDFETGKYDDLVVEISNIPISSVVAVRQEDYEDDDDFMNLNGLSFQEKLEAIKRHELFIIDLHSSKDKIVIKLIKK